MKHKTVGTIAIVAALVAVLAVPVLAEAGRNGRGAAKKSAAATLSQARKAAKAAARSQASSASTGTPKFKGQRLAQLNKRIANKLNARRHRFEAASANLNKRIDRIASLATTVAAAGGDVTAVNAKLDSAREHLANALALEQATIAKFQEIPSADNRRAAFFDARAKGREAVAELKLARVALRDAAATLRAVVDGL